MQHIHLIAVGKTSGYAAQGVAEYQKRLGAFCRFTLTEIAEEPLREKAAGAALVAAALEKEGRRILAAVPKGAALVPLCVEGRQLTSEAFAGWLAEAAGGSRPTVAFVIGSSHGLAPAVKQQATLRLSLSAMTLPHQLARVVLCEQLYRAMAIRAGSKYHK